MPRCSTSRPSCQKRPSRSTTIRLSRLRPSGGGRVKNSGWSPGLTNQKRAADRKLGQPASKHHETHQTSRFLGGGIARRRAVLPHYANRRRGAQRPERADSWGRRRSSTRGAPALRPNEAALAQRPARKRRDGSTKYPLSSAERPISIRNSIWLRSTKPISTLCERPPKVTEVRTKRRSSV